VRGVGGGEGLTGCGKRGEAAAIGALRSIYPVDFGSSPGRPTTHAPRRMGPGALTSRLRESGGPPPLAAPLPGGIPAVRVLHEGLLVPAGPAPGLRRQDLQGPRPTPSSATPRTFGPPCVFPSRGPMADSVGPNSHQMRRPRINGTPIAGNFLVCATKVVIFKLHFFSMPMAF